MVNIILPPHSWPTYWALPLWFSYKEYFVYSENILIHNSKKLNNKLGYYCDSDQLVVILDVIRRSVSFIGEPPPIPSTTSR